jgi:Holliday junction DNA helicase RuvA
MIGSLRGTVLERIGPGQMLIEVAGVGYEVTMTTRSAAGLAVGSSAFVHVHHHVREDLQQLFAFTSGADRTAFKILIATHGVGPALALAILDVHDPSALADIVARADTAALCLVPGIGRKTAERLLVELRSRLDLPALQADPASGSGSRLAEVRAALEQLGYNPGEIVEALRGVDPEADTATSLRLALGALGARNA